MGKTGTNLEDLNQIIKNLGEALQETQKSMKREKTENFVPKEF